MRNTLISCVVFAVGAAFGSAVTWKFVKTKYEKIAQEEINSVKEVFSNRQSEPTEDDTENEVVEEEQIVGQLDIRGYAEKLQDMNYVDYSSNSKPDVIANEKAESTTKPYVISPDEFAERKDYDTVSLTYYKDKVLTYENDEIVEDVDGLVGRDSLNHFGEYEDDSVFVRNDELKCDYEILLDQRNYTDAVNRHPHRAEGEWEETK